MIKQKMELTGNDFKKTKLAIKVTKNLQSPQMLRIRGLGI